LIAITEEGGGCPVGSSVVLLTGASGFVGKSVSARASHCGFEIRGAVRSNQDLSSPWVQVEVGEINDANAWQLVLEDVATVLHLAARVHIMQDTTSDPIAAFRAVNVGGTLNLARQAATAGVKRFVFISTAKVNGESTQPDRPFTEADIPNPQDAYSLSKYEAEQGLRQISADTGLEVVIIRPPLVYGPGVKANFATLMQAVQQGRPLALGSVNNRRSLVALDNLVDFIITCMTHPRAANQTFLVSDGNDLSTAELVRGLARAAGVSPRLLPVPVWALQAGAMLLGKEDEVQRLCGSLQVDISKARNLLGWRPPVVVEEGLRRAVAGMSGAPKLA
jgi:nucleoside-diphosphate-sugar epimerase